MTARALVQIVHILRDHRHIVVLLHFSQHQVPSVGLSRGQLLAQTIVEICHQIGVAQPSLGRGHLLHGVFLPQSACIAERFKATLGTDARTGQYNEFLLHNHRS